MNYSFFYHIPLLLVGFIILILLLAVLEVGYRIGIKQRISSLSGDAGGGKAAQSTMFALLGLILAFTYASGVSRYGDRKQAVIDESNALGTAFYRASLIAEPGGRALQETILNYAKTRVTPQDEIPSKSDIMGILNNTLEAQNKLWPTLTIALDQNKNKPGPLEVLVIAAVNDLLDMHTIRIEAIFEKLPTAVIWMLIFISAGTISITGYNAGLSGRISRWRTSLLTLMIVAVMLIIFDYDRPADGFIQVSQNSLHSVIAEMEAYLEKSDIP